eukprot:COSAG03_NODE_852_length_5626_cov_3.831011_3_plen_62_part_00
MQLKVNRDYSFEQTTSSMSQLCSSASAPQAGFTYQPKRAQQMLPGLTDGSRAVDLTCRWRV